MNKQKYLIVGSNNFWYTTTEPVDQKGLEKEIAVVKAGIEKGDYHVDDEVEMPETLRAYPLAGESVNFPVEIEAEEED